MEIADHSEIRWLVTRHQGEPWGDFLKLAVWAIVTTGFVAFYFLELYSYFKGRK